MDKQAELTDNTVYEGVQQYYGQTLQSSSDLQTDACRCGDDQAEHIKQALSLVNDEIKGKYYGCGSPIPLCLKGLNVLDLGCGTGRDCYVMSKLVGGEGFVSGIDMTENQVAVAKKHIDQQMKIFGYGKANVKFIYDYIENLPEYFEKESLDLITSNCVINLTEDKQIIMQRVYDALKFGGEMFFSDIYADRRVPEDISKDPLLRGECLGGALYYKDFERIAKKAGFTDPRVFSKRKIEIKNPQVISRTGNINFCSVTYRLWKIKKLEDACEDYGHVAVYKGSIAESPFSFKLDDGHIFYKDKPERICGNTALMLSGTRLAKHFEVLGSFKQHFGLFENCGKIAQDDPAPSAGGCCC